jgi:hypothetical protein
MGHPFQGREKVGPSAKAGSPRSVLSQVPKSEAPGPPIFCGCGHFSRHLGHPASVVVLTSTGTWATRPGLNEGCGFPPFRDGTAEGWGTHFRDGKRLGHPPKPARQGLCSPRCPKARHLGHPSFVVVVTSPDTWATRPVRLPLCHLGASRTSEEGNQRPESFLACFALSG